MSNPVPSDPGYAPGSHSHASGTTSSATSGPIKPPAAQPPSAAGRWAFPGFVLVALVAFVGWRVADIMLAPAKPPRGVAPIAVEIAPVERTTVVDRAAYTASLEPFARFVVAPRVGGRLERLHVHIGDEVTHGAQIAEMDSAEFLEVVEEHKAAQKVATAEKTARDAALTAAKRELERLQKTDPGIVIQADIDVATDRVALAEAAVGVAQAQLEEATAQLKAATLQLGYATLTADWNDKDATRLVGERYVDEGDTMAAHDPIVSLIDISSVIAVIHVPGRDYPRVAGAADLTATITTDAWPGEVFHGTVLRVAPMLDEASRQARVEVLVPNPDHKLRPGMFAKVQILLETRHNTPTVPVAALVRHNGQSGVFVVHGRGGDMTAAFLPVTPDIFDGDRVSILPEPDGPVVTLGHHLLQDGAAVKLPPAKKDDGKAGTSGKSGEVSSEGRR